MRKNQNGFVSFNFFVFLLLAGLVLLSFFLLSLSRKEAALKKAVKLSPSEAKLNALDEKIYNLYSELNDIETMRNSRKYLEIIREAEPKITESDYLWEKKAKPNKGIMAGMATGVSETYQGRFTTREKFEMLSKKYSLSPSRLRRLKADFEMMFMEEYTNKFAVPTESEPEEKKEVK